jgi:hypothetical protein
MQKLVALKVRQLVGVVELRARCSCTALDAKGAQAAP